MILFLYFLYCKKNNYVDLIDREFRLAGRRVDRYFARGSLMYKQTIECDTSKSVSYISNQSLINDCQHFRLKEPSTQVLLKINFFIYLRIVNQEGRQVNVLKARSI